MLTHTQLARLENALRGTRTLSVYIDGTITDPAAQRFWRVELAQRLAAARLAVADAPREERVAFDACVEALEALTREMPGGVGAPGWAAFITPSRVHHAGPLSEPVATSVFWRDGAWLGPYVRALPRATPVVVAIADAKHAELHRFADDLLDRVESVHAHHPVAAPAHMGGARVGFHTGTRGSTGRENAQRSLRAGRDRMLARAAERVATLAGPDGWIVLGGTQRVISQIVRALGADAGDRVMELPSLDVHATEAEIAAAGRRGAALLRASAIGRRLAAITDDAGALGLGALGEDVVRAALESACVRDLYVTPAYVERHGASAEAAIRAALAQDATVSIVPDEAAPGLDEHGGIGAGLRFRTTLVDAAASGSATALAGV